MWNVEKEFSVKLGGNTYINTPNLVVYKHEPLFKIRRNDEDGMLGIDFDVFDSKGNRVTTFRKGIVVQGDKKNYEVASSHTEYTVTEKSSSRVIANVKRRDVQGAELEVSVRLYTPDGFLFDATPTETNIGGVKMVGNIIKNCVAGIVIR